MAPSPRTLAVGGDAPACAALRSRGPCGAGGGARARCAAGQGARAVGALLADGLQTGGMKVPNAFPGRRGGDQLLKL